MENLPTFMTVVAAAIGDREGRILLQQVLPHKHHAGQWEFPGGKVENEEIPRVALCREIAEELGLVLSPTMLEPAGFAEEPARDGRPALVLLLYTCTVWSGVPEGREGQNWGWFTSADAAGLAMPPADRALLEALLAEKEGVWRARKDSNL